MKKFVSFPESKFFKVACRKCENKQIIFNKSSVEIKCFKCGEILAIPTGGKVSLVGAKILDILT